MKTERTVYLIFIVILIALNIFILYRFNQNKNNIEVNIEADRNYNDPDTSLYYNLFDIANASNNSNIDSNVVLTNHKGYKFKLYEIIDNFPILIFDFKQINCKTCFEDEMNRLIRFSKEIGTDNIIFVSSFKTKREQHVLENKYGIDIFDIGENDFGLPIEKEFCPFVFLIDSNYIADGFYIPTKEFYPMGDIYLNIIYNKYFAVSGLQ